MYIKFVFPNLMCASNDCSIQIGNQMVGHLVKFVHTSYFVYHLFSTMNYLHICYTIIEWLYGFQWHFCKNHILFQMCPQSHFKPSPKLSFKQYYTYNMRGGIIAYEQTCQSIQHKNLVPYRFVVDSSQMTLSTLMLNL